MSLWRRTALERFPELRRAIADAEGVGWVWFALRHALRSAYQNAPVDAAFAADVYDYAHWCLHHRSFHVRVSVTDWFYEDLATDDLLRPDMARWVSQEDFDLLAFTWRDVLTEENWDAFRQEFAARKAQLHGIASRKQRNLIKKADKSP